MAKSIAGFLLVSCAALTACQPPAQPELYKCSALADNNSCRQLPGPVCARVDTGVRCIRPPCPSSALKPYSSACDACADNKVDVVFTGSCEVMQQQLEDGALD